MITTVVSNYTTAGQIKEKDRELICVGVEILFDEAPKEGCTLSKEAITESIIRQLPHPHDIHDFENVAVKVKVIDDERKLLVTFNTTEHVERDIRDYRRRIILPLDEETCNETTSFADKDS